MHFIYKLFITCAIKMVAIYELGVSATPRLVEHYQMAQRLLVDGNEFID